jgi:WD40 repeat protein
MRAQAFTSRVTRGRAALVLAIAGLAAAGCGGDDGADPLAVLDTPLGAIDAGSLDRLVAAARWGDGRAVAVAVDPERDALVAVTTVGVEIIAGGTADEVPVAIDRVADRAVVADGGRSLVTTSITDGATVVEVWRTTDGARVASSGPYPNGTRSLLRLSDAAVLAGTATELLRIDPVSGATTTWLAAPAGTTFGQPAAAAAAPLVAVPTLAGDVAGIDVVGADGVVVRSLRPDLPDGIAADIDATQVSADGAWAAAVVRDPTFGRDDEIVVWSTADGRIAARVAASSTPASTARPSAPFVGDRLLVADPAGAVTALDPMGGTLAVVVPAEASAVTALASSIDGATFAVGRADGTTAVYDATTSAEVTRVVGDSSAVVALAADAEAFVALAASGRIERIGGAVPSIIDRYATADPTTVTVSSDGQLVATALADGSVDVRDIDGTLRQRLLTGSGRVDAAAFSPDGAWIATAAGQRVGPIAYDDTLRIWTTSVDAGGVTVSEPDDATARIGGEQEDVAGCTYFRNGVTFTPDGTQVVTASHDYTVQLYDLERGDVAHVFDGPRDSVLGLAVSGDGRYLAAAAEDGVVRVWRLADRALVHELTGGAAGFWSVAFSPTGRLLAGSDASGAVRLWDVDSAELVGELAGVKNTASNLAFSPDGRLLAAGAEDTAIGVWDVRSGERLATLRGHEGVVQAVTFTPDGSTLLSAGLDDVVRVWRVGP